MFAINVVLTVKDPAHVDQVAQLLRRAGQLSRNEPGCNVFEVCHADNEPTVFNLIERWDSKEAWEVHKTAEAFTTIYQPQVLPLVDRTPYFCAILE
ncbi:MAG: antibiotic biosynthesis monooxygenase [Planctomycetaceae bacterium]|nr:antibiotic biosynthesis monooxygenase [Planctomycetaceae bacterium]